MIKVGDEKITKMELLRRTIALHPEFRPCDIQRHVKSEYGVDCTSGQASSVRTSYFSSKPKPHKNGKPASVEADKAIVTARVLITTPSIPGIRALKEAVRLLGKEACSEILEVMSEQLTA